MKSFHVISNWDKHYYLLNLLMLKYSIPTPQLISQILLIHLLKYIYSCVKYKRRGSNKWDYRFWKKNIFNLSSKKIYLSIYRVIDSVFHFYWDAYNLKSVENKLTPNNTNVRSLFICRCKLTNKFSKWMEDGLLFFSSATPQNKIFI